MRELRGRRNGRAYAVATHDDDVAGSDAEIDLRLSSLPSNVSNIRIREFRIDDQHSNAFAEWKRLGSPQNPTTEQYRKLESAGKLAQIGADRSTGMQNGVANLKLTLPRQAVSLLQVTW